MNDHETPPRRSTPPWRRILRAAAFGLALAAVLPAGVHAAATDEEAARRREAAERRREAYEARLERAAERRRRLEERLERDRQRRLEARAERLERRRARQEGDADGPRRDEAPARGTAAASSQVASFDFAWQRIHDTYFKPDFGGLDWESVRDELRPRALRAKTREELRPVIGDMLQRLGESHFQLLPAELTEISADGDGATRGDGALGIEIRLVDGRPLVTGLVPGSPAEVAGIHAGWIVRSVDELDLEERWRRMAEAVDDEASARLQFLVLAHRALAGDVGSTTRVGFVHGGDRDATFELERGPQPGTLSRLGNLPAMRTRFERRLLGPGDVGYVRFNIWMTPVAEPFTEAVTEFVARGVDGMVIDLRGNPGGIGGMVIGVAGHFVHEQGLSLGRMITRGADLRFMANPRSVIFDGPVAILVDELSMSTSELFAAGLQELGRARVFGTPSPGMALPSIVEKLPNGDSLQFAIADLLGPSGERIEGRGVIPDEIVEPERAALLAGRDPALEAALGWIRSRPITPPRASGEPAGSRPNTIAPAVLPLGSATALELEP